MSASQRSESDLYVEKYHRLFKKFEREFEKENGLQVPPCELADFQTLRAMELADRGRILKGGRCAD